eukprot:gene5255-5307_t
MNFSEHLDSCAGRFFVIASALKLAVGNAIRPGFIPAAMAMLVVRRIGRVQGLLMLLEARFLAGRLRRRVAVASGAAGAGGAAEPAVRERPAQATAALRLPRRFGWLCPLVPGEAACFAGHMRVALAEPGMQELLAACPQAVRLLGPVCRMLGIERDVYVPAAELAVEAAAALVRAEVRVRVRAEARVRARAAREERVRLEWAREDAHYAISGVPRRYRLRVGGVAGLVGRVEAAGPGLAEGVLAGSAGRAWQEALVPLGMSSWKKCGTSVWKVRLTSLKNSARAGGAQRARAVVPTDAQSMVHIILAGAITATSPLAISKILCQTDGSIAAVYLTRHFEGPNIMKAISRSCGPIGALGIFACSIVFTASSVAAAPLLGSATSFVVIGATDVTNTGTTTVNGEVGVSPGSSVTWPSTPPASGTLHVADTTAAAAVSDALSAFTGLMGLSFTTALTGQDLGTVGVLSPGVYSYSSAAQLTGTLTLDFGNVSNASFVFQIGSALTTAAASKVVVLNGDATDSVYFVVGSSATLGTATQFAGNILAWTSITMTTGAQLSCGRALALHGAVTLDSNLVSNDCSGGGDLVWGFPG